MFRHDRRRDGRRTLRCTTLLLAPLLTVGLDPSAWAADTDDPDEATVGKAYRSSVYVVQLADEPAATYGGGVDGLKATRPAAGRRLDSGSAAVRKYVDHLDEQHEDVLEKVSARGGKQPRKLYDYGYAFNGFAARLTGAQAAELAVTPGVLAVTPDEMLKIPETTGTADSTEATETGKVAGTSRTAQAAAAAPAAKTAARAEQAADPTPLPDIPGFLGLTGDKGLWSKFPGGGARAGEGMIVGVIDTGFDPDNPMLAPLPEPRPDADAIAKKWRGACDPGAASDPGHRISCNNKVIGADYFREGLSSPGPLDHASPLDVEGHGTHTATTAAGNYQVPASLKGTVLSGTLSGMAPAARVAIYKTCWLDAGCPSVDVVAAIDKAVADGVDVINMSLGAPAYRMNDPVYIAQFNAAAAGVFIAASSGNLGPDTVQNVGPWVTTVAASTDDTGYRANLTLGDGQVFSGSGTGTALPSAPLVDSSAVGAADASATEVQYCYDGALDPAKTAGKIVICTRGGTGRTEKSAEVRAAGGVGMVMTNTSDAQDFNTDVHAVPTVQVNATDGAVIRAYADAGGATAELGAPTRVTQRAPNVAAFSSSGPEYLTSGDILKPDLTAPGVSVAAGVVPGGTNGGPGGFEGSFGVLSGTSMSSPHVAGLATLIRAQHPDWSPMEVKSALMTTARTTDNEGEPIQRGTVDATPADYGAGRVEPTSALDPGLVYDSTSHDWTDFLCSGGQPPTTTDGGDPCADVSGELDSSDLNYPAVTVGRMTGTQTITRTVTNIDTKKATYKATLQTPPGYKAVVSPKTLTLEPGASASYTVTFTRTSAAYDEWVYGSLTWSDAHSHHRVRSPIGLSARQLDASAGATGTGTEGSLTLTPQVGWKGDLSTALRGGGLYKDQVQTATLTGTNPDFRLYPEPSAGPATAKLTVEVPEGTTLARFATFDAEHAQGQEFDLYVYKDGTVWTYSRGPTNEESVQLTEPGTYTVYVNQWQAPDSTTALPLTLHTWFVGGDADSPATATPTTQRVVQGDKVPVTVAWQGLDPTRRYFGVVDYREGTGTDAVPAGRTLLTVTP